MADRRSVSGSKGPALVLPEGVQEAESARRERPGRKPQAAPPTMQEFAAADKRSMTVHRGEMIGYVQGWWTGLLAYEYLRHEHRWPRRLVRWLTRKGPVTEDEAVFQVEHGWRPW